jgi:hypothetical protein
MWELFIHGCQSDQSTAYSYIASNQLKKRATKCNELFGPQKMLRKMDTGLAGRTRNHIPQNIYVQNMMSKFVQFIFLNLLCREHKVIKLCDLFVYWLPNTTPLYWIFRKKTVWNLKDSVSHHAYIHEPRLSRNMRKSSVWTDHEDVIRWRSITICGAKKLTACILLLYIMLHCVSVPLSDVSPVVS